MTADTFPGLGLAEYCPWCGDKFELATRWQRTEKVLMTCSGGHLWTGETAVEIYKAREAAGLSQRLEEVRYER